MSTAVETVCTYVQLAGSGQMLHCVDKYSDLLERVEAVRSTALILGDEERMGNPMGMSLVHARMVAKLGEDENGVVDVAFNPMHILCMYRAHPDA